MSYREQIIAAYMQVSDGREWAINGVDDPLPAFYAIAFNAGAASRDAEIAELNKDRLLQIDLKTQFMRELAESEDRCAELVAALEPFSGIDLVESRVPAEFAMLVLRARAAIAKVREL